jgi:hypothetical protein
VLRELILPAFAANCASILWIGVRRYTRGYPALLERNGATCWTLDVDPAARAHGHGARHVTADLLDLPSWAPPGRFDAVLCNGVFGYGINSPTAQHAAVLAMSDLLADGGWLLLGWNTHRIEDPLHCATGSGLFRPASLAGLPVRLPVPGTTHVFDILSRCASPAAAPAPAPAVRPPALASPEVEG